MKSRRAEGSGSTSVSEGATATGPPGPRSTLNPRNPGGPRPRGPVVDLARRAPGLEPSVEQESDLVTQEESLLPVVGHVDRCRSEGPEDPTKLRPEFRLHLDVDRGERFVQQDQARAGGQRPGERHLLAFPAR